MKNRRGFWSMIFTASLIMTALCIWLLINHFYCDKSVKKYLNKTSGQSSDLSVAENHNINWNKLIKDNEDTYSWIYIPNTNVDYPVLQSAESEEDDFYLSHNINKESEFAGSIYSEKQNAKDYSDLVTVLYGHNMKNGSMFKTLHNFEDASFFKKNKYIYIYMPEHKLTYKIYTAYVYDDRHILSSFDFNNKKVLKKYLKYTQNHDSDTKNTREVQLNADSRILTLSTCTNGTENTRYLVQGVLVKDEPTN